MKKFISLNGDILLEIAQHLEERDLLSLAQTCRTLARIAETHTYWHLSSLSASRAISTFLPVDQIGPWTGYSTTLIRGAIVKRNIFAKRWKSEVVYPKTRVRLLRPKGLLSVVPSSRWSVDETLLRSVGFYSITVIDGKTGKMTAPMDVLDKELQKAGWRVYNTTVAASSKNPNELLLGAVLVASGELKPVLVSVFRITIAQDVNGLLEISKAHLRTFHDVPYGDKAKLHDNYIVLEHRPTHITPRISIGHISSGRLWSWNLSTQIWDSWLFDEWYLVCLRDPSNFRVIPFYLPSLMAHDTSIPLAGTLLPEGERLLLPSLFGKPASDAPFAALPSCSVSIAHSDDSGMAPSLGERLTLIVSRPAEYPHWETTARLSYILSISPPMDSAASPYGDVVRLTSPRDLPSNEKTQLTDGHKRAALDITTKEVFSCSRQSGFEVLHYRMTMRNAMADVKITDLYGEGWTRSLVWDGDEAKSEGCFVQTYVALWDASIGMVLLESYDGPWPEPGKTDYEVLWL